MTREEAINTVRNIYQTDKEKEALSVLIPELRESEDERIRSCIGIALTDVNEQRFKDFGITLKDCLSWLEKQKEQKPAEWSDSIAKEMFIKALERAAEQTKKGYELTDCDKHSWWEDFKAYSGINPAEWNEEDKKSFDNVLSGLKYAYEDLINHKSFGSAEDVKNAFDWFKSFRPQPKQEWSEEDEILRVRTINRLETLNFHGISGKEIRESIDWLKSLKSHWKPSEEEIEAVKYFVNKHQSEAWAATGQWKQFTALRGLLENLMKLRKDC